MKVQLLCIDRFHFQSKQSIGILSRFHGLAMNTYCTSICTRVVKIGFKNNLRRG